MRLLTQSECRLSSCAAFIEGYVTDDFAVAGAAAGLFIGVLGLGLYAPSLYPHKIHKMITLKESIGCVLGTAWTCAKYGLIVDALWGIYSTFS